MSKYPDFIARVRQEGQAHYRDLPWRNLDDPYAVLVSEVMLQQTQVARVLGKWERWMELFPTVEALAEAPNSVILEQWQGLGYNRRCLALKRAAEACVADWGGALPKTAEDLQKLPGIGPATAGGVMAFAYNKPALYLETNVRTVFLHEFFPDSASVSDKKLIPLVMETCPQDDPRSWYYALLDYGAHLKSIMPNPSRRSKHYARQSTFEGSHRQKRAEVVRIVLANPGIDLEGVAAGLAAFEADHGRTPVDGAELCRIIDELLREGFFREENGTFSA